MAERLVQPSASVEKALAGFKPDERVRSWQLAWAVLSLHREYGDKMADRLVAIPGPEGGDALQVGDWLNQAAELYQPDSIDVLDGRLLIWGLASVDRSLGEYLGSSGFLAALQREIESEQGRLRKLLRDLNRLPPGISLADDDVDRLAPASGDVGRLRSVETDTGAPEEGSKTPPGASLDAVQEESGRKPSEKGTRGESADDKGEKVGETKVEETSPSVRLAEELARTVDPSRPADSVLLLAAVLYQGATDSTKAGAAVFPALRGAIQPEKEALPPDLEIVTLLGLKDTYGLDSLGVGSAPEGDSSAAHTVELDRVLDRARGLATGIAPAGPVQDHHLLAALLAPVPGSERPLAQGCLRNAGYELAPLRQALVGWIHGALTGPTEPWKQALAVYLTPEPGYISDYVDRKTPVPDHLSIEDEVRTIAHVLMSTWCQPSTLVGPFRRLGQRQDIFHDQTDGSDFCHRRPLPRRGERDRPQS